ncbi:MAG: adenylate/guanylate cyclase domain-containing protein [SAR324 cluster bacterium]|nr:adenylate/guanylate cyclase domain-containing protein [SAR324 cluster bacterium]
MKASRFIKLRTGHKLAIGAAITVVMAALTLLPQAKEFFQGMENRMQDFIYFFRESLPVEDTRALPIVMVFVDEKSLDQEKYRFRQPTPRKLLADVVRDLNTLGAKCIGLDFMFLRKHWEEQDQALLTALKESKAPVVTVKALPKLFEKKIDDPETFKDAKRLGILESLAPHTLLGFSEVIVGSRGIARYMVLGDDRRDLGGFAPVLFKTCLGQPVKLPGFVDPQKMKLLYYGPPTRLKTPLFNVIAAHELAQLAEFARKDAEMPSPVRGKIVLVGSGAETLRDTFPSPFSVVMEADPGDPTVSGKSGQAPEFVEIFGVELHAMALAMFLQNRFLEDLSDMWLLVLLLVFYGAITFSSLFLRTGFAVALYPVFAVGWIVLAGYLFIAENLVAAMALPLILGVAAFLLCQVLLYATETRYSKFLQTTFSRYISPVVVNEMVENRLGLDLGGEMREMSILFSDLAGFTTLSEGLSPRDLVSKLNVYFTGMTEEVFKEAGTVGDFIGDAVMAYFGAPTPQPDHPIRVCRTALGMKVSLAALNQQWRKDNKAELAMRIGLHTGEVIMGNVGSEHRQDFTIIGDAVNLSARLEGVNKVFSTIVIVSEATLGRTEGLFRTRQLGRIVVKGKTKPVQIYELLDTVEGMATEDDPALQPQQLEYHKRYEEGLEFFYRGRFKEALSHFEQNGGNNGDAASAFMVAQCRVFMEQPPQEPWAGEVVLTSK